MALTERQERLYTDIVDIYIPNQPSEIADSDGYDLPNNVAADLTFSPIPKYKGIRCKYFQTDELAAPGPLGITNQSNVDVIDKFHFDAIYDIEVTWLLQLKTPRHPDYGLWWVIMGDVQRRIDLSGRRRPNRGKIFAYRIPAPKFYTPPDTP